MMRGHLPKILVIAVAVGLLVCLGCDDTGAMANKSFRLAAAKGRLTPVGTWMFGVTGVVESRQVRVGAEAVRRTGER
jgi:hypothetical protein